MKIKVIKWMLPFLLAWGCMSPAEQKTEKVIIISANAEWNVVKAVFPDEKIFKSPWGEYFFKDLKSGGLADKVIFFHGGWGKVAAAGSTQYCIDHWAPRYIINLGTCGGIFGRLKKMDIVLVDKTIIYDISEAMGDSEGAIRDYTTTIDLAWLGTDFPTPVTKTLLVSADQDLITTKIPMLVSRYQAVAGDWESGAIAYTCAKNNQRFLILRGVSDLVSIENGEAYDNEQVFIQGTDSVMRKLLRDLPSWLRKCN